MPELYPFQRIGVDTLHSFANAGGAILGDEPGLGKTPQALTFARERDDLDILVVCPSSLKVNWARETAIWYPEAHTRILSGRKSLAYTFGSRGVSIVNYDLLGGIDWSRCAFDQVIFDEAHRLRNPDAGWTKAAAAIPARYRLLVTGTPIVNRPKDIWQLMVMIGMASPVQFHDFGLRYCGARQMPNFRSFGKGRKRVTKRVMEWNYDGAANLEELAGLLQGSAMVRRRKADVLTELPAKTRRVIELPKPGNVSFRAERAADDAVRRLRDRSFRSAVGELDDEIQLAFDEIALVRHETALKKVRAAAEYITDALEEDRKVVAFAHHRDVIEQLAQSLGEKGKRVVQLHGGTSQVNRQRAVDAFQQLDAVDVFLGQIYASGEGLTLTAASRAIFVELDWTPSMMTQCEDRLHRIGQLGNVLVDYLVYDGSIDARMAKSLVRKQKIIDRAIDSSVPPTVNWLNELGGAVVVP